MRQVDCIPLLQARSVYAVSAKWAGDARRLKMEIPLLQLRTVLLLLLMGCWSRVYVFGQGTTILSNRARFKNRAGKNSRPAMVFSRCVICVKVPHSIVLT